jgi:hypothetical protein
MGQMCNKDPPKNIFRDEVKALQLLPYTNQRQQIVFVHQDFLAGLYCSNFVNIIDDTVILFFHYDGGFMVVQRM